MRRLAARTVALVVLSIAVAPWLAASSPPEARSPAPSQGSRDPTIEPLGSVEIVASDRPAGSMLAKRAEGLRLAAAIADAMAVAGRSPSDDAVPVSPLSAGSLAPLALHLAGRAPPVPSAP
jgi:hypothetical protein